MITLAEVQEMVDEANQAVKDDNEEHAMLVVGHLYERIVAMVAKGCNQFHAQKLAKLALSNEWEG